MNPRSTYQRQAYEAFEDQKAANQKDFELWTDKVAALSGEAKSAYEALVARDVPADLYEQLLAVAGDQDDATRSHAGRIEQTVAKLVPSLVGGSADLAGSVKTTVKGSSDIAAGEFEGRNFNFGVREHGMGSILNGLALSGMFLPFGSTFLIFSDYMRPPMRLAGLMKQQVTYVFTHDSIFLGEDGPTHQPVEQLWTLRMVPNLDVFRPADAVECAAAWAHAMLRRTGPTALSLTRHTVPALKRPEGFDLNEILNGGYVLSDDTDLDLVLIATGSEVGDALEVKKILAASGKKVRVVSMPCVEAFLRLSSEKQEAVLPSGVRRASYELGVTSPWKAVTGLDGIEIGINDFGASAPYERLQTEYGVSAKQAAEKILQAL